MKKGISTILAVCMMIGATAAFGANREGQFSVSPVIGGYTFDSPQRIGHRSNLLFGGRAGYNITDNFGIEGLLDYVNTDLTKSNNTEMFRYGGELLYHFMPDNVFVPYLAVGLSGMNFTKGGIDRKAHAAFDYGVGAKVFATDNFALRCDIRHIITTYASETRNNLEYTLGAYIPFGGVKPVAKAVEPPAPAVEPAPAPKPAEPAPAPKPAEPPPAPAPAPKLAPVATLTVAPEKITRGGSATLKWKSQNATDCTIQPGIGPVSTSGSRLISPDASTTYTISCTGAGGAAGSAAAVDVVAPVVKAEASPERFCSKPAIINIQFDTDKSNIKPQYTADLQNVGQFLSEFPKARGEISGHTDNVGSKAYNDKLSQARAESVKKYLVEKFGIAAERINAKGYGFSKPVATNKTKAGKAKNRRIEANFTCE